MIVEDKGIEIDCWMDEWIEIKKKYTYRKKEARHGHICMLVFIDLNRLLTLSILQSTNLKISLSTGCSLNIVFFP